MELEYRDNTLTMTISDTGTDMTEEQIKRIYAPFNRLENADTQEGFGLGLSITQELVRLMGGTIEVRSLVDVGSRFTVKLPAIEGDAEVMQLTDKGTVRLPEGLRVAVLDDDGVVLKMTVEMLSRKKIQVVGLPYCGRTVRQDAQERLRPHHHGYHAGRYEWLRPAGVSAQCQHRQLKERASACHDRKDGEEPRGICQGRLQRLHPP